MRGIEVFFCGNLNISHTHTHTRTFCGRQPHPGKGKPSAPNGHGAASRKTIEHNVHFMWEKGRRENSVIRADESGSIHSTYRRAQARLVRLYRRGPLFDHAYLNANANGKQNNFQNRNGLF